MIMKEPQKTISNIIQPGKLCLAQKMYVGFASIDLSLPATHFLGFSHLFHFSQEEI